MLWIVFCLLTEFIKGIYSFAELTKLEMSMSTSMIRIQWFFILIKNLINNPNIDCKAPWLLSRVLFTTNLRIKTQDDFFLFKVQQLRPNIELWCRNFLFSRSPMLVAFWDTIHLFGCMSLDARLRSSWNNTSVHYAKKSFLYLPLFISFVGILTFENKTFWKERIKEGYVKVDSISLALFISVARKLHSP